MSKETAGDASAQAWEAMGKDLLRALHLAAAHELPGLIQQHTAGLGISEVVAYLADLQQVVLVPFLGTSERRIRPHHNELSIDATMAGWSYQHVQIRIQGVDAGDGGVRVWVPLIDGTDRLGVLGVTVDRLQLRDAPVNHGGAPDGVAAQAGLAIEDGLASRLRGLAALIAELVVTKSVYGDTIVRTRRRARMGLAAEIQWGLLPPLTFACSQVMISGALEPAYRVAGDSIDYAVDAGIARFAIFDGMGHGLQSAQLAALAVAAYRNARRDDQPLTGTAHTIDDAVRQGFRGESFTTAVLAELDTSTGKLSWINAGHPEPLLLRQGRLVKSLHVEPGLPFGLDLFPGPGRYPVGVEHLQPGDQVLFHTDGVIEARSPEGEHFGVPRLVDLLVRNSAAPLPAPETMRRVVRALLEYQQGQLDDDATLLLVEWHSGTQESLLP